MSRPGAFLCAGTAIWLGFAAVGCDAPPLTPVQSPPAPDQRPEVVLDPLRTEELKARLLQFSVDDLLPRRLSPQDAEKIAAQFQRAEIAYQASNLHPEKRAAAQAEIDLLDQMCIEIIGLSFGELMQVREP